MTSNMRMEFLGLMGAVPHAENGSDPESYTVIMPDLEHGLKDNRLPLYSGQQPHIPQHVAAIIVPADSVMPSSDRKPSLTFRGEKGPFSDQNYFLYALKQEKIDVVGLESARLDAPNQPVDPDNPATQSPTSNDSSQGLQWIPRLALANRAGSSETGRLDAPRFLNSDGTPKHTGDLALAATLPVTSGKFFVDGVFSREGAPELFEMVVPDTDEAVWRQSIYQNIVWEAPLDDATLELVFTSGVDSQSNRVLLRAADGIKIRVANLELEQLLEVGGPTAPLSGSDIDYAVSYLYCSDIPNPDAMPVPSVNNYVGGSASPRCTAATFEAA